MDYEDLLRNYMGVCNQALQANKDRFPFKQILSAAPQAMSYKLVHAKIIDNNNEVSFKIKIKDNQLFCDLDECVSDCGKCCGSCGMSNSVWEINLNYLNDVIRHPLQYIENPAKLDWEWIHID